MNVIIVLFTAVIIHAFGNWWHIILHYNMRSSAREQLLYVCYAVFLKVIWYFIFYNCKNRFISTWFTLRLFNKIQPSYKIHEAWSCDVILICFVFVDYQRHMSEVSFSKSFLFTYFIRIRFSSSIITFKDVHLFILNAHIPSKCRMQSIIWESIILCWKNFVKYLASGRSEWISFLNNGIFSKTIIFLRNV